MGVADVTLKVDVDTGEAEMTSGGSATVMPGMPGESIAGAAGYAALTVRQCCFTADIVYRALGEVYPMLKGFYSVFALAPSGAISFMLFALLAGQLTQSGVASFLGLLFCDNAGALKAANDLAVTNWVEPLPAGFVLALTARLLHAAPPA